MIRQLTLQGHDSELFSFLPPHLVDPIRSHPMRDVPLWTFGTVRGDALHSVTVWNAVAGFTAKVWTRPPFIRTDGQWKTTNGSYTTNDDLVKVTALALVRHLFSAGYTAEINHLQWIHEPADPTLARLRFIRHYEPSRDRGPWECLQLKYAHWTLNALDALGRLSRKP